MCTCHIDPQHPDGTQRKYARARFVQKAESEDQDQDFCYVRCEQVYNESSDVLEQAATFADSYDNGIEVANASVCQVNEMNRSKDGELTRPSRLDLKHLLRHLNQPCPWQCRRERASRQVNH